MIFVWGDALQVCGSPPTGRQGSRKVAQQKTSSALEDVFVLGRVMVS